MSSKKIRKSVVAKSMSVLLSLAMTLLPLIGGVKAARADAKTWPQAVVRPGVMGGGNGEGGTDFFVDILLPLRSMSTEGSIFFVNPHLRLDDGGGSEGNLGFGYRAFAFDDTAILGFNAFLDTMKSSEEGHRYNQWGVGIEALSHWADFRANYYRPYGDTLNRVPRLDGFKFGHTALLLGLGYEEALKGYDAEVGFLVPGISDVMETRVYGGHYWYNSDIVNDSRVSGNKFRVEVRPAPLVDLAVEMRDDDISGTDTFFGGYIEIPFESMASLKSPFKDFGKGTRPLSDRMTDKVVRDRHIVSHVYGWQETAQDDPIIIKDIIYVNEDNPNPGSGTLSDPYQDIMDAEGDARYLDGAYVYVFSWDAIADTYDDVNLTLMDDMALWGQAYEFYGLGGNGPMPILDGNGSGSVITLGDNNEIMGLTIQNGATGIYGADIHGASIHDNLIQGNGADTGILIVNAFDNVAAMSAGGSLNFNIFNNTITANDIGVSISNTVSDDVAITGLTIANTLTNNTVSGSFAGDGVTITNSVVAPSISSVAVANTLDTNVISGNSARGVDITNSVFANGAYDTSTGDLVASVTGSTIENTLIDNVLDDNSDDGVSINNYLYASSETAAYSSIDASVLASVTNSTITNTLINNDVTNSGYSGIVVENNLYAYADLFDSSATGDVIATVDPSGVTNLFEDNYIASNGYNGIYVGNDIYAFAGVDAAYSDSTSEYSSAGGDVLATVASGTVSNVFNRNIVTGNSNDGVNAQSYVHAEAGAFSSAYAFDESRYAYTTIGGDAIASITSSGISNAFDSNTIGSYDTSGGNGGDGVYLVNALYAEAGVAAYASADAYSVTWDVSSYAGADTYLYGDAVADISDSGITNTFTNNSATINDNGSNGVYIYNALYADAGAFSSADANASYASNSSPYTSAWTTAYVYGYIEASVATSGIENTFDANVINNNGSNGVYLYNEVSATAGLEVYAYADASNSVSYYYWDADPSSNAYATAASYGYSTVTGNGVDALVTNSGINNTFSYNTIGQGEDGNGYNGVSVSNNLFADAGESAWAYSWTNDPYSSADDYDTLAYSSAYASDHTSYSVNAAVAGSAISNSFSTNTISGNYGEGVTSYSDLHASAGPYAYAYADASGAYSTVYESDGGSDEYSYTSSHAYAEAETYDSAFASVSSSGIYGSYIGNIVYSNEYGGISAYNALYAEARADTYGFSYAGDTDRSDTYTSAYASTYSSTYTDGLTADVTNGVISNVFDTNEMVYNSGDGVSIANNLYTYAGAYSYMSADAAYSMNSAYAYSYGTAGVDGTIDSYVADSAIRNSFNGNTVEVNDGIGVNASNSLYAEAGTFAYALTDASNASSSADVYAAAGSTAEVFASVYSGVYGGAISNDFTGNTIGDNNSDGVSLSNDLYASAIGHSYSSADGSWAYSTGTNIYSYSSSEALSSADGGYYADVTYSEATENDSGISNSFDANAINSNYGAGARIANDLYAEAGVESYASSNSGDNYYSLAYTSVYATSDSDSTAGSGVSANVDYGYVYNTFDGANSINSNSSDGVAILNDLHASAFAYASSYANAAYASNYYWYTTSSSSATTYSSVNGDLSAGVYSGEIVNTFNDNSATINNNNGAGVYIENALYASVSADAYTSAFAGHDDGYFYSSADSDADVNVYGASATVDYGYIGNTFYNNTISDNYGAGVYIYNDLYALGEAYTSSYADVSNTYDSGSDSSAYSSAYVSNDLAAGVTDSAIENTFDTNTIDDNSYYGGDGVHLDNDLYAAVSAGALSYGYNNGSSTYYSSADSDSDTSVYGGMTATVDPSYIANTFYNNSISSNGSDGVQSYSSIYAEAVVFAYASSYATGNDTYSTDYSYASSEARSSAYVYGDVGATVDDAAISNSFDYNTISYNSDGSGVNLYNDIHAYAGVVANAHADASDTYSTNYASSWSTAEADAQVGNWSDCDWYGICAGVSASVTSSGIDNSFGTSYATSYSTNDINNNGSNGVRIYNELYAYSEAYSSAWAKVSYATADGYYSSYASAESYASADATSRVSGDLIAGVENSGITNSFSHNAINDNGSNGVDIQNYLYAEAHVDSNGRSYASNARAYEDDSDSYVSTYASADAISQVGDWDACYWYGYGCSDVLASVTFSDITNSFSDNTIGYYDSYYEVDHGNGSDGVHIYNDLHAYADAYSYSSANADDSYADEYDTAYATSYASADALVWGDLMASVDDSFVASSFDRNTISYNTGDGVDITSYLYAEAHVDSFSSARAASGDSYYSSETYVSSDSSADSNVNDDVSASVSSSYIENTFTDNAAATISNNGGWGVTLYNELYAYADAYSSAYANADYAYNDDPDYSSTGVYAYSSAEIGGDLGARVDNSHIANTFTDNVINDNSSGGVQINNYLYAEANTQAYANAYDTSYTTAYAYSSAIVDGDMYAVVDPSYITNEFTDNTIEGNIGAGVYIYNSLYAYAYTTADSWYNSNGYATAYSTVWGDALAFVVSGEINNIFDPNYIEYNGSLMSGVHIENNMWADIYDGGYIEGSTDASIITSAVNNTFDSNTIANNSGYGVYIEDYTYADDTEDVEVTTFMENNVVIYNGNYGVYLSYSGNGLYSGDLGDGVLSSSSGLNEFYGNGGTYGDLACYTGTTIRAEENWWGDLNPTDQWDPTGDTVDDSPFLFSDPHP